MFLGCLMYSLVIFEIVVGYKHDIAWSGGPMHLECEHGTEMLTRAGQYRRENVIAIKAVTFNDEIYVLTPRLKSGIPATVWQIVDGRAGVELQAFPDLPSHSVADCEAIQNAVDLYLDHLGKLWILDSGLIEIMERPRCVCPPKVVVVNILLRKPSRRIHLSSLVDSGSVLQSIVVDHGIARPFVFLLRLGHAVHVGCKLRRILLYNLIKIPVNEEKVERSTQLKFTSIYCLKFWILGYVSDASRGAILVHDTLSGASWTVHAVAPGPGLQLALVRRGPGHTALLLAQLHLRGLLELDTASLRRKSSFAPRMTYGEHSKPVIILGADLHHVYLRHPGCSDVLSWDTRTPYNSSDLPSVHSPGPRLTPTSVAPDHLKPILLVLDSDYADSMRANRETYHKITFVGKL